MKREGWLTAALVSLCGLLAGVNLGPRLSFQKTDIIASAPEMTVSIAGAVQQPGSYVLAWGARVEDLIQAAGGFSAEADRHLVKLADPLDAGEAIFVPGVTTETGEERISINSASMAELDTLPRVGPATAQRIIEGRPYNTLEDLLKVKGIGPKTLEQLRPRITL